MYFGQNYQKEVDPFWPNRHFFKQHLPSDLLLFQDHNNEWATLPVVILRKM